jgi:hypothetical protein
MRRTGAGDRLTEICLTIDTEFSIGSSFERPDSCDPVGEQAVYCRDRSGTAHGLDFILATLDRYAIPATFFVEALNVCHFGDEPMGRIARQIHARGHDVQLHLHPAWLRCRDPNWRRSVVSHPPSDSMADYSPAELAQMIGLGIDCFRRWGLPRPIALRAGNLQANLAVYRAMRDHGLVLASNLGLAIHQPVEHALQLYGGRHWIDGVLELPVLTYVDVALGRTRHWHSLTLTGCSPAETCTLLAAAEAARLTPVTILTHPFEFAHIEDESFTRVRGSAINRARLHKLCRFLDDNRHRFAAVRVSDRSRAWLAAPGTENPTFHAPLSIFLARALANTLNDVTNPVALRRWRSRARRASAAWSQKVRADTIS